MKNNIDTSFGLQEINKLYEKIKSTLREVAVQENLLENPSIVVSHDESYNNLEEMEMLTNAEIQTFNRSQKSIFLFKWALIVFESFGAYLAIGLIMHAWNLEGLLDESFHFILVIVRWLIAVIFSYAIVNFAIKTVKPKNDEAKIGNDKLLIAFLSILSLPLFNVLLIYGIKLEIDSKEIYLISLFFTLFTGSLLVLRSKSISEKEEKRIIMLKKFQKSFEQRKKLYKTAENLHLKIFKKNNEYDGFLEELDVISDSNKLFLPLKKFLSYGNDFDQWASEYIRDMKSQQNLRV